MNDAEISQGRKKYKVDSETIYNDGIRKANIEVATTERQDKPTLVILAGQSGAGKGSIAKKQEQRFSKSGRAIVSNIDAYRSSHPNIKEIQEEFKSDASQITMAYAIGINKYILEEAKKNSRNVIADQTSSDVRHITKLNNQFNPYPKQKKYKVELHAVATNYDISDMRKHYRYEESGGFEKGGRFVPQKVHDDSYKGVANTIKIAEEKKTVDSIYIYDKKGTQIYENKLVDGEWENEPKGYQVFTNERMRELTVKERHQLVDGWNSVTLSMIDRNAEIKEPTYSQGVKEKISALAEKGFKIGFPEIAKAGRNYSGEISAISDKNVIQKRSSEPYAVIHNRKNLTNFKEDDLHQKLRISYDSELKGKIKDSLGSQIDKTRNHEVEKNQTQEKQLDGFSK